MDEDEVRAFLQRKLDEAPDEAAMWRMQDIMVCEFIDKHIYRVRRRFRDYIVMECDRCGKIKDVHASYWLFLLTVPGAVLEKDSEFIK